ncbi:MAG: methionine synthase [Chloroflexota bacterium]|jgi:methionine synthase II (cobalamin-independent)
MALQGNFQTTAVGSFPHQGGAAVSERLAALLDIPCWPQLPRRDFRESMYIQYSTALPGIKLDEAHEKIIFDTTGDLSDALERFYSHYLADDLDAFGLQPEYAAGFFDMLEVLDSTSGAWAKGQVTGPISFGLTVTDQDLRASLYDELLADTIVKNAAWNARWQIRQLLDVRPNALMFVDEPYMAAFGSAYISLTREQAVAMLDEVFAAIHQEGTVAGVHCCANTDWSVLLATSVDVLNLDAYGYVENLALYPAELRAFLDRGGLIAWGIVPNNGDIMSQTAEKLAQRLWQGLELVAGKAQARGIDIRAEELGARSLITTSCGLGPTTVPIAERALETLAQMGALLR